MREKICTTPDRFGHFGHLHHVMKSTRHFLGQVWSKVNAYIVPLGKITNSLDLNGHRANKRYQTYLHPFWILMQIFSATFWLSKVENFGGILWGMKISLFTGSWSKVITRFYLLSLFLTKMLLTYIFYQNLDN